MDRALFLQSVLCLVTWMLEWTALQSLRGFKEKLGGVLSPVPRVLTQA